MQTIKLFIQGNTKSGQVELFNGIQSKIKNPALISHDLGEYLLIGNNQKNNLKTNSFEYVLYKNNQKYKLLSFSNSIILYCHDLNKPFDNSLLEIRELEKRNLNATVIVIGLNADKKKAEFEKNHYNFLYFETPIQSENRTGYVDNFAAILDEIAIFAEKKATAISLPSLKIESDFLGAAVRHCELLAAYLPISLHQGILDEIANLIEKLNSNQPPEDSIHLFVTACNEIIKNKPIQIKKLIIDIICTLLVSLVTMAAVFTLGFFMGFAAGLWAGPLALLSGVLAGSAAAITAVSMTIAGGAIATGLAIPYFFFAPSFMDKTCMDAIDQVAKEAQSYLNSKPQI